jgi:hypothetical protein
MALDSELNILSEAKDVAYQLRTELFAQCTGQSGPAQFGDMEKTFKDWGVAASKNKKLISDGGHLKSQLVPFYVDRKPGYPVI